jgi:flagellar secretion chaperone FliS
MRASIACYRQNDLAGVQALVEGNPHRRVAALYQGIMERLELALSCLRSGDNARKSGALSSASNIMVALRASLDHQAGGDIAAGLDALYEYSILRLLQANIGNDPGTILEIRDLMGGIVQAWNAVADSVAVKP